MKVYCSECENACSDKADTCPTCGHPLTVRGAEGVFSLITLQGKPKWIAATIVVGIVVSLIGIYARRTPPPTQAPAVPVMQPEIQQPVAAQAPVSKRGIGWSLAMVEQNWGAAHGWYWLTKERLDSVGINWLATNTDYPEYGFRVEGMPSDLSLFASIVVLYGMDTMDEQTATTHVSMVALMGSTILGVDASETLPLLKRVTAKWTLTPGTRVAATEVFGGRTLTIRLVPITEGRADAASLAYVVERAIDPRLPHLREP